MKTFLQILQKDCGGYPLRQIIDNLDDEQIIECVAEYAKQHYCKGGDGTQKLLLKTLYKEIEAHCSEHIKSGGLRFYGVSFAEIKQIFEVLGYKEEPKF